ncbi:MAG: radical SAM protein [Ignavibacteriae bacterium]|nr:radical SAM protein [Ignavibacteriota bacterium]
MNNKVIVICGDIPEESSGKDIRDNLRLKIDGTEATIDFIYSYLTNKKNADLALKALNEFNAPKFILTNGVYLSQYLGSNGFEVLLIPFFSLHKNDLIKALKDEHLAVVISATFLNSKEHIDKICSFVRDQSPKSIIIAGGLKIWKSFLTVNKIKNYSLDYNTLDKLKADTYFIDAAMQSPVDIFVINERGESTLSRLLNALKSGEDYRGLCNISYKVNGKFVINQIKQEPGNFMDGIIDWSLIPKTLSGAEFPVQAGTGCQMRCAYCDFIHVRDNYLRPSSELIKELGTIPGKVRKVFFTNDNLFFTIKKANELCSEFIRAKLNMNWRAFMRVNVINDETAALMYESGCRECILGIESGDPSILKRMNKGINPDKILSAISSLNKVGIFTQSTFIVGFPGETSLTVQNTIDLINSYETAGPGINHYYLFQFTLLPLSLIFSNEERSKYKIEGYMNDWSHYTMNSKEAAQQMIKISDSVKPEINPVYFETPIIPGLSIKELKQFYFTRNKLMKIQRGLTIEENEKNLWDELERVVLKVKF